VNNARVRLTDARLLIIFVLMIVLLGVVWTYAKVNSDALTDFRRQSNANCESNRKNTQAFNAFIGTLQGVTLGSPLLSKADREQRVDFYQAAKQPVPRCPLPPPGARVKPKTDPPPPPPTEGIASP
jgi:hypothetical protein